VNLSPLMITFTILCKNANNFGANIVGQGQNMTRTTVLQFQGREPGWLMLYFSRPSHLIYIFCNFFSKIFNVEKVMVFDRMDDFFSLLSTAAPARYKTREGLVLSDASSI